MRSGSLWAGSYWQLIPAKIVTVTLNTKACRNQLASIKPSPTIIAIAFTPCLGHSWQLLVTCFLATSPALIGCCVSLKMRVGSVSLLLWGCSWDHWTELTDNGLGETVASLSSVCGWFSMFMWSLLTYGYLGESLHLSSMWHLSLGESFEAVT